MTRCESYPLCSGTIYFPTAPFYFYNLLSLFASMMYTYESVYSFSDQ